MFNEAVDWQYLFHRVVPSVPFHSRIFNVTYNYLYLLEVSRFNERLERSSFSDDPVSLLRSTSKHTVASVLLSFDIRLLEASCVS
jgi:hypothetical protein